MMKSINTARLSVYVDQEVHPIYEKLTSRSFKKAEDFPFETMKDLFVVAACLGAKNSMFVELNKTREIFDSTLFNQRTEVPVLLSLAFYKTKDIEVLNDNRQVLDIVQGWANGGIRILEDYLLNRPGRPLFNLVDYIWQEIESSPDATISLVRSSISGFSEERDNELLNEKPSKNFNTTDCTDLLTILEIELRAFIATRLSSVNEKWWKQRIPEDVRTRAEKRKHDREEPYPGREKQDRSLWDYLDFPDLKTIITQKNNWDDTFKQVFIKSEIVQVKLDEINPFRNDIAHHRDIPLHDREIFVSNIRQILRTIRINQI
jgi:dnd system-associated protein 4